MHSFANALMCTQVVRRFKNCSSQPRHTFTEDVMCEPAAAANVWCTPLTVGTGVAKTSTSIVCPTCNHVRYQVCRTRACSSFMGPGSAEPGGGSSGGQQPSALDLDSEGTQIIQLGSAWNGGSL
jgi:hypothetical protein